MCEVAGGSIFTSASGEETAYWCFVFLLSEMSSISDDVFDFGNC